nr:hypothetical protein [Tanacetum cinerariifolium]
MMIPPKKSRDKGPQGKKTIDIAEATIDVSEESDPEPARKRIASRRVVKKKLTIFAADNIIPNPDFTLELGKCISLTKVAKEEAARQVHATYARIMIESVPEPARRIPSGYFDEFEDLSSHELTKVDFRRVVKKKLTIFAADNIIPNPDFTLELGKCISLTKVAKEEAARQVHATYARIMIESVPEPARRIPSAADIMQALKESKKTSRRHPDTKGSCEGTGRIPRVPDESTVVSATSSEGTDNDKETNDEFVHGDEKVNDDEDEEMKNAELEESGNSDEENTDAVKTDAGKTKEVKDDAKKTELPLTSSSLSLSSDAEINSLLDIKIQYEVPHIQSPYVLTIPVLVIFEPLVLTPIPETPLVASSTTLLPPPFVSTIPPVLFQATTPIPLPPITTEAPTITTAVPESNAFTNVQLRVAKLEKDVFELKKMITLLKLLLLSNHKFQRLLNIILDPKLVLLHNKRKPVKLRHQNYDGDAAFDGKEHDFDAKKPESEVIHSSSSSA